MDPDVKRQALGNTASVSLVWNAARRPCIPAIKLSMAGRASNCCRNPYGPRVDPQREDLAWLLSTDEPSRQIELNGAYLANRLQGQSTREAQRQR